MFGTACSVRITHHLTGVIDGVGLARRAAEGAEVDWRAAAVGPKGGVLNTAGIVRKAYDLAVGINAVGLAGGSAQGAQVQYRAAAVGPKGRMGITGGGVCKTGDLTRVIVLRAWLAVPPSVPRSTNETEL